MSAQRTVLLKVFRYGPDDAAPRYDEFPVSGRAPHHRAGRPAGRPPPPGPQPHRPALVLHGSCGTCGMRVNGREVLACVTRLGGQGEPVVVEPLAGAAVAGDLVVDMEHVYRRLEPVGRAPPWSGPPSALEQDKDGRPVWVPCWRSWNASRTASSAACACRPARSPGTLASSGLAVLAAAERVLEDPRGADLKAVLGLVDDAHGAWRCHTAFECSAVCPAGVDPGAAIMRGCVAACPGPAAPAVGRYHREVRS